MGRRDLLRATWRTCWPTTPSTRVEILTPTHLHHDHVIAALEAGKHVSVQKPRGQLRRRRASTMAGGGAERSGRTLRISECFVHYPPLELAKQLVADGAIGKPTSLRIRTLVGQTDSAFQAGLRPEGYGWRLDKRSPGGHLFDDMVHKYAMALWLLDLDITSVQAVVRRRDLFFEPCAVIFEYEDPDVLGMMEVQYAPNFYMRSSYYGADEFFEITGDEGQIWVTRATGEMLDLAPVMLFTGTPQERKTTRVHRHRRRLGRRLRALVPALRRLARSKGRPARHDAPPRPPTCCGSASPSTRRRRRAPRSTPAPSTGIGQPTRLGGLVVPPRIYSHGGGPTSIRASGERTVPKRSSPADHCRRASDTSSRLRPTKFHHMRSGSGKGRRRAAGRGPGAGPRAGTRRAPPE